MPRLAERRPLYAGHGPTCCAVCREVAQLACFIDTAAPPAARAVATEILGAISMIDLGRYGGVEVADLFD